MGNTGIVIAMLFLKCNKRNAPFTITPCPVYDYACLSHTVGSACYLGALAFDAWKVFAHKLA